MEYRFLEPVDVLYLRGNKLFGDAGAHGEALMPPWPSLAAGGLRSRMLVDAGCDPRDYGSHRTDPPGVLKSVLGTPDSPGSFRVSFFSLGQKRGTEIEPFLPLPADVVIRQTENDLRPLPLEPVKPNAALLSGYPLQRLPLLRSEDRFKPTERVWLSLEGIRCYLEGSSIPGEGLVRQSHLWQYDTRLGIALNSEKRTAETGRIYTAETVSLAPNIGFVVGVSGADGMVPRNGFLRFGGDGRGVRLMEGSFRFPGTPWDRIWQERRFRLLVTSPAIFPGGWILPGCRVEAGKWIWEYAGMRAQLSAACVKRHGVVSGWDLALGQPKAALRTVPTGSVYWFEGLEGAHEGLERLAETGLWDPSDLENHAPRLAEGFNGVLVAAWPKT